MTSKLLSMSGSPRRSPLALVVLAMLYEAPMHPYRMQQLIRERGKDEVVNVRQRASIYQTIGRLLLTDWMRDMLATPARDFPGFPAALAFLPLLEADDVAAQLDGRAASLERELARIEAAMAATADFLPRVFVIEDEYRTALLRTELSFVLSLAADLREGRLGWSEEWLSKLAAAQAAGSV